MSERIQRIMRGRAGRLFVAGSLATASVLPGCGGGGESTELHPGQTVIIKGRGWYNPNCANSKEIVVEAVDSERFLGQCKSEAPTSGTGVVTVNEDNTWTEHGTVRVCPEGTAPGGSNDSSCAWYPKSNLEPSSTP